MIATSRQIGFDDATFKALLAARDEPDWLVDERRRAWAMFCEMPWPDRRGEEWMRTDIRLFKLDRYAMPGSADTDADTEVPQSLLAEGVSPAGRTVTIDSRPVMTRLDEKWVRAGVLFGSLDRLLAEHAERIRPHLLTGAVDPGYDRFAALHAACWSGGRLLYVPRGVIVEEPLHALSAMTDGGVDFGRTVVVLEEGAEATFLSETAGVGRGAGADGLHCGATELLVGPGARLRYVSLQNWAQGVWHFAHQKALVDRGASLEWTIAAIGSRLAKVNQHVALVGRGAECQINGAMFAEGKQHLSYHTLQHHLAPDSKSDLLYRAALQGRSQTVWRGMIKVDPAAQKTDGYQRNDNLMLSPDARADSIPGLEIEADDVRCTHGSTSGRVDEEQIFYARSRGYSRREAVGAIVLGFFQQVFDRIPLGSVRQSLGAAIARGIREYD